MPTCSQPVSKSQNVMVLTTTGFGMKIILKPYRLTWPDFSQEILGPKTAKMGSIFFEFKSLFFTNFANFDKVSPRRFFVSGHRLTLILLVTERKKFHLLFPTDLCIFLIMVRGDHDWRKDSPFTPFCHIHCMFTQLNLLEECQSVSHLVYWFASQPAG